MPIEDTDVFRAARQFQEPLNGLLARTITQTHLTVFSAAESGLVSVAFRQSGGPSEALLITNPQRTRIRLSIGQVCEGVEQPNGRVRLRTIKYRYAITPDGNREPLFRWEYAKRPPDGHRECRHHLHQDINSAALGGSTLRLHIPTGYTFIEDIIRFCINDLGVSPISPSHNWHETLNESESRAKEEFMVEGDRG